MQRLQKFAYITIVMNVAVSSLWAAELRQKQFSNNQENLRNSGVRNNKENSGPKSCMRQPRNFGAALAVNIESNSLRAAQISGAQKSVRFLNVVEIEEFDVPPQERAEKEFTKNKVKDNAGRNFRERACERAKASDFNENAKMFGESTGENSASDDSRSDDSEQSQCSEESSSDVSVDSSSDRNSEENSSSDSEEENRRREAFYAQIVNPIPLSPEVGKKPVNWWEF